MLYQIFSLGLTTQGKEWENHRLVCGSGLGSWWGLPHKQLVLSVASQDGQGILTPGSSHPHSTAQPAPLHHKLPWGSEPLQQQWTSWKSKRTHQVQRSGTGSCRLSGRAQAQQALLKLGAEPLGLVGPQGADAGKLAHHRPGLSLGDGWGVFFQELWQKKDQCHNYPDNATKTWLPKQIPALRTPTQQGNRESISNQPHTHMYIFFFGRYFWNTVEGAVCLPKILWFALRAKTGEFPERFILVKLSDKQLICDIKLDFPLEIIIA